MRLPVRWKLLLWIVVPLMVIYLSVLGFITYRLLDRAYQQVELALQRHTMYYAERFDGQFSTAAQIATSTASFLEAHEDLTEPELYRLLQSNVGDNPLVYGAAIAFEPHGFDSQRKLFSPYVYRKPDNTPVSMDIAARPDGVHGYDYTDGQWEWYSRPKELGKAVWTEPYYDQGAGNIHMCTFSVPFYRDGQLRGVATIDIPLEKLQQQVGVTDVRDAQFVIISRMGRFVSHPSGKLVQQDTVHSAATRIQRADLEDLGKAMMAGDSGAVKVPAMDGTDRTLWVAYAPIPSTGWSFALGVPEDTVLGQFREQVTRAVAGLGIALLLMVAAVWYLSARITRPVTRLAEGVQRVGRGDFEKLSQRISSNDEIGDLALAFDRMVVDLDKHVRALTVESAAREAVESELRVARQIQKSLLPRTFPPFPDRNEFELYAINAPAKRVAGDFYDFILLPGDTLFFVIADVSGKGVPAAMFMAVARTVLRNLATQMRSPAQVLNEANLMLHADNIGTMFVTLFLGFYEVKTGRLRYASAAHPPPLLLKADGRIASFGRVTGTLLGIMDDQRFDEGEGHLDAGDRLLLYTDGVVEARSPDGSFLGDDGLLAVLERHKAKEIFALGNAIADDVAAFQKGDRHDDLTLLILERRA